MKEGLHVFEIFQPEETFKLSQVFPAAKLIQPFHFPQCQFAISCGNMGDCPQYNAISHIHGHHSMHAPQVVPESRMSIPCYCVSEKKGLQILIRTVRVGTGSDPRILVVISKDNSLHADTMNESQTGYIYSPSKQKIRRRVCSGVV